MTIKMNFLQQNIDITDFSNYKTPTVAKYLYEIQTLDDAKNIPTISHWCDTQDLPFLIVAWGTNMLFAFDEYPWVILKNNLTGWSYDTATCILETSSQDAIWEIAESLENDYKQDLWHRFIWLPWSVWGAIYGNAWCFGLEVENNFVSAQVLEIETWDIHTFSKADMDFSYRNSRLKKEAGKYFLLSARFDLSKKIEKYHSDVDNIYFREQVQPKWNSCGSFFKNPKGKLVLETDEVIFEEDSSYEIEFHEQETRNLSAGYLLEQEWFKWYKLWGAYFSEKHANFLMHDGTGTYRDLLQLIELAQKRVYERYGIDLINEVQILFPE